MCAPSPDVPPVDEDFARAILARDFERAAQLLAHGARVNRVLRTTETFDRDVVEETSTLLINASRAGEVDAVRFLLAHGADPNIAAEYSGRTALTEASAWGQAGAVDALLAGGADFTTVDRYNHRDALGYAMEKVKPDIVRSLLTAGAKGTFQRLNFSINGGQAARDVIQLLIDHGTDINEIDDWGRTPLMWAAAYAELDTVRFMIERGADLHRVSEKNMNGVNSHHTALGLALAAKRSDVVALLQQHGATNVGDFSALGSFFDRIRDAFS